MFSGSQERKLQRRSVKSRSESERGSDPVPKKKTKKEQVMIQSEHEVVEVEGKICFRNVVMMLDAFKEALLQIDSFSFLNSISALKHLNSQNVKDIILLLYLVCLVFCYNSKSYWLLIRQK